MGLQNTQWTKNSDRSCSVNDFQGGTRNTQEESQRIESKNGKQNSRPTCIERRKCEMKMTNDISRVEAPSLHLVETINYLHLETAFSEKQGG